MKSPRMRYILGQERNKLCKIIMKSPRMRYALGQERNKLCKIIMKRPRMRYALGPARNQQGCEYLYQVDYMETILKI